MHVDVGAGRLSPDAFRKIFESANLSQAKTLAPPQGLVFANVRYDDKIDA
jgi:tRNA U38,U39,U40 pseudouridine synthase TruA